MEQAHRILSIYTRLLQQKVVNKHALSHEWHVSSRTIQRDIDNIRNFLYDTDEWHGYRNEITYNHKLETYELDSSESNNEVSLYFLLTLLQTISPEIDQRLHNYLELLIATFHTQHEVELRAQLSKLKVSKQNEELKNIALITQAINNTQKLLINPDEEVTPIGIEYFNFTFNLIYKINHQIKNTKLKALTVALSPNHFHTQAVANDKPWITFEMSSEFYHLISKKYVHEIIKQIDKNTYIVRMRMCVDDAVNFCFTARHQARLMGPENIYQVVMKELLKLQESYLFTRISS